MIRALKASMLAFTIACTRRFVDTKKNHPRRAPTTDIPPPSRDLSYVEWPIENLLNHESFSLHEANTGATGPKSFNDELRKRPL